MARPTAIRAITAPAATTLRPMATEICGTGDAVEQGDAVDHEGRGEGADDEVLEAGLDADRQSAAGRR